MLLDSFDQECEAILSVEAARGHVGGPFVVVVFVHETRVVEESKLDTLNAVGGVASEGELVCFVGPLVNLEHLIGEVHPSAELFCPVVVEARSEFGKADVVEGVDGNGIGGAEEAILEAINAEFMCGLVETELLHVAAVHCVMARA